MKFSLYAKIMASSHQYLITCFKILSSHKKPVIWIISVLYILSGYMCCITCWREFWNTMYVFTKNLKTYNFFYICHVVMPRGANHVVRAAAFITYVHNVVNVFSVNQWRIFTRTDGRVFTMIIDLCLLNVNVCDILNGVCRKFPCDDIICCVTDYCIFYMYCWKYKMYEYLSYFYCSINSVMMVMFL